MISLTLLTLSNRFLHRQRVLLVLSRASDRDLQKVRRSTDRASTQAKSLRFRQVRQREITNGCHPGPARQDSAGYRAQQERTDSTAFRGKRWELNFLKNFMNFPLPNRRSSPMYSDRIENSTRILSSRSAIASNKKTSSRRTRRRESSRTASATTGERSAAAWERRAPECMYRSTVGSTFRSGC